MELKKFNSGSIQYSTPCKVLFGSCVPFSKCVGWCSAKKKFLTAHQMLKKGCLGKQCTKFYQIENRMFWKQRQEKMAFLMKSKVWTMMMNTSDTENLRKRKQRTTAKN